MEKDKRKHDADLGTTSSLNKLLEMMTLLEPKKIADLGLNYNFKLPPLHREIADAKFLPKESNLDKCLLKMEESHENNRVLGTILFSMLASGTIA